MGVSGKHKLHVSISIGRAEHILEDVDVQCSGAGRSLSKRMVLFCMYMMRKQTIPSMEWDIFANGLSEGHQFYGTYGESFRGQ